MNRSCRNRGLHSSKRQKKHPAQAATRAGNSLQLLTKDSTMEPDLNPSKQKAPVPSTFQAAVAIDGDRLELFLPKAALAAAATIGKLGGRLRLKLEEGKATLDSCYGALAARVILPLSTNGDEFLETDEFDVSLPADLMETASRMDGDTGIKKIKGESDPPEQLAVSVSEVYDTVKHETLSKINIRAPLTNQEASQATGDPPSRIDAVLDRLFSPALRYDNVSHSFRTEDLAALVTFLKRSQLETVVLGFPPKEAFHDPRKKNKDQFVPPAVWFANLAGLSHEAKVIGLLRRGGTESYEVKEGVKFFYGLGDYRDLPLGVYEDGQSDMVDEAAVASVPEPKAVVEEAGGPINGGPIDGESDLGDEGNDNDDEKAES